MKSPGYISIEGRRVRYEWIKHSLIISVLLLESFAFYMMLQISVKDNASFLVNPWLPPMDIFSEADAPQKVDTSAWHWENYGEAMPFIFPYVANTIFVAFFSTTGTLLLAILGAYFFARYKMPFSGPIWAAFLFLMLMPAIANIVPLFTLLKTLGLLNSLWGIILVQVATCQAFNIFVLRGFIEDLPKDLFEAAEIDGASHWQQIRNIVIPLSKPILSTLAILLFIQSWNEYVLPFIALRDHDLFTVGVGLIYLDGEYVKQWGLVMAAFFLSSIPIIVLFLFFMRYFIRGVLSGAIKG